MSVPTIERPDVHPDVVVELHHATADESAELINNSRQGEVYRLERDANTYEVTVESDITLEQRRAITVK